MLKRILPLLFFSLLASAAFSNSIPSTEKINRKFIDTDIAKAVIRSADFFFFKEALYYDNDEILDLLAQKATTVTDIEALAHVANTHAKKLYFPDTHAIFKVDILKAVFRHFNKPVDMISFCESLSNFKIHFINFAISSKDWGSFAQELAVIQRESNAFKSDLIRILARKATLNNYLNENYSLIHAVKRILPHRTGEDLQAFLDLDFTRLFSDDMKPFSRADLLEALAASRRNNQDLLKLIDIVSADKSALSPPNADGHSKACLIMQLVRSTADPNHLNARKNVIEKYKNSGVGNRASAFDRTRVTAAILSSWRDAPEIDAFLSVMTSDDNEKILFTKPDQTTHRASLIVGYAKSHRKADQIMPFAREYRALEVAIYTDIMQDVHRTLITETFAESMIGPHKLESFVWAVNNNKDKFFTPAMDGQFQQEIWQALVRANLNAKEIYRVASNIEPFDVCREYDLYAAYDHKKIILKALEK